MSEKGKLAVGSLVTLLLFLAPGYLLHVSPRFAGSLAGGIIGIVGALLLILLLVYPLVKHIKWLNPKVTGRISLKALLTFHIYAGIIGPILGIIHSGHKYQSPVGIALVLTMLVVVISGFVGRYYLANVFVELRQQQAMLGTLRNAYNRVATVLGGRGAAVAANNTEPKGGASANIPILPLVDAMADLEYAIGSRESVKRLLSGWMVVHVIAAIAMYLLLGLHIWSGIYYGLRWLP